MKSLHKIISALVLTGAAVAAHATPAVYGGSFFVGATGSVEATFLGQTAAYTNELFFSTDSTNWTYIFNNHTTPVGTTVGLGNFTAGTELFFKIYVQNTNNTFYSGAGSKNADGIVHVASDLLNNGDTYVGFEDLYGGGDKDYDDVKYSFHNIAAVPEADTYAIMGLGLGLVGFVARRRARKV